MVLKYFFTFFLVSFFTAYSSEKTPEDVEIEAIQNRIKELNLRILKLEKKKSDRLQDYSSNKKIGLVLSGGGAKGFAHIGVLKELEKNGIKIDYIAGTSMGAVIATLYSLGYSPDEIEKLTATLDIESIMTGKLSRSDFSLEKKAGTPSKLLSLKYDDKLNFSFPKGLNNSMITYLKLKNLLWSAEEIDDFDKLPIPLRIISTNLDTGESIAFKQGDLALALTSSIAIPAVMTPVKIDGGHYVDGMIAKNFPVDDLINMGADIIIGSDVGVELNEQKDHDFISIFNQLLAFYSTRSTAEQKNLATFVIAPPVKEFSPLDFTKANELIKIGEQSTKEIAAEVKNFIPKENLKTHQKLADNSKNSFLFSSFYFTENSNISNGAKETISGILNRYKNRELDSEFVETIFLKIASLDLVEQLNYTFDSKNNTLILEGDESPSNNLYVGVNFRSDYGTTFSFNTNLFNAGQISSHTDLGLKFGDYLGIKLSNIHYYGIGNKIGLYSNFESSESPFFVYKDKLRTSKYIVRNSNFQLALASQINNRFQILYGTSLLSENLKLNIGDQVLPYNGRHELAEGFVKLYYDSLNDRYFPTAGRKGELLSWGGRDLTKGSDKLEYIGIATDSNLFLPVSENFSLQLGFSGGYAETDAEIISKYIKVGGILSNTGNLEFAFPGLPLHGILAKNAYIGRLGLSYMVRPKLFLKGLYSLGSFKKVSSSLLYLEETFLEDFTQGLGIGLAYDSFVGPLEISVSRSGDGNDKYLIQINMGYYFD